jgi:hypothetical protein
MENYCKEHIWPRLENWSCHNGDYHVGVYCCNNCCAVKVVQQLSANSLITTSIIQGENKYKFFTKEVLEIIERCSQEQDLAIWTDSIRYFNSLARQIWRNDWPEQLNPDTDELSCIPNEFNRKI